MAVLKILAGLLFIIYGLFVGWWRALKPESLFKYAAMQKRWGRTRGRLLHTFTYTMLPVLFGLFLLWK
ncbi:MAG: hypothetical protein LBD99_04760 [Candidatus Margulisbacteria bacterium]|nr:hypothetical protein [Candidatus Margulisiibacteriota bacterium]